MLQHRRRTEDLQDYQSKNYKVRGTLCRAQRFLRDPSLRKTTETFLLNWRFPKLQWPPWLRNGRNSTQQELYQELVVWAHQAIKGKRTWWSFWMNFRDTDWRWDKIIGWQLEPLVITNLGCTADLLRYKLAEGLCLRRKILWSDESKQELFGHDPKILNLKETRRPHSEAQWWHHAVGVFVNQHWRTVRMRGKFNRENT